MIPAPVYQQQQGIDPMVLLLLAYAQQQKQQQAQQKQKGGALEGLLGLGAAGGGGAALFGGAEAGLPAVPELTGILAEGMPAFSFEAGAPALTASIEGGVPAFSSAVDGGLTLGEGAAGIGETGAGLAGSGLGTVAGAIGAPISAYGMYQAYKKKNPLMGALSGAGLGGSLALMGVPYAAPVIIGAALAGGALGSNWGDKDRFKDEYKRAQKLREAGVQWNYNAAEPSSGRSKEDLVKEEEAKIAAGQYGNPEFARTRDEKLLKPEDIVGYSFLPEIIGNAYAGAPLDKQLAMAGEALKGGVREHHGTIDYLGDKQALINAANAILGGSAPSQRWQPLSQAQKQAEPQKAEASPYPYGSAGDRTRKGISALLNNMSKTTQNFPQLAGESLGAIGGPGIGSLISQMPGGVIPKSSAPQKMDGESFRRMIGMLNRD